MARGENKNKMVKAVGSLGFSTVHRSHKSGNRRSGRFSKNKLSALERSLDLLKKQMGL